MVQGKHSVVNGSVLSSLHTTNCSGQTTTLDEYTLQYECVLMVQCKDASTTGNLLHLLKFDKSVVGDVYLKIIQSNVFNSGVGRPTTHPHFNVIAVAPVH